MFLHHQAHFISSLYFVVTPVCMQIESYAESRYSYMLHVSIEIDIIIMKCTGV